METNDSNDATGWIRTIDLWLMRPALYLTELPRNLWYELLCVMYLLLNIDRVSHRIHNVDSVGNP